MGAFFVYMLKTAVCLTVFYLFYRLLLSKETFHRFNRVALLVMMVASCIIPCIELTTYYSTDLSRSLLTLEEMMEFQHTEVMGDEAPVFHWQSIILFVYFIGVVFFAAYKLVSLIQMFRLFRKGECVSDVNGVKVLVYDDDRISPFSWMNYIVLSRKDYAENAATVIAHEKAHIGMHHSIDILIVDICIVFQWFNPAIWLLKQELQNIHEYEADDAVIREGVDARKYQLLLIEKAVGTRLYSMANSFNHNSLKKRITMMCKRKSNKWAMLKCIYVLPLAAFAVTAFARPEVSSSLNEISNSKVSEISDFIKSEGVKKAEIKEDTSQVFRVVEEMPEFPGGTGACMKFLGENIKYPENAKKNGVEGRVIVQFIVEKDGRISNIRIVRGVDPEIDAEAKRVITMMPKWKPGKQRGQEVRVYYTVPLTFSLSKNNHTVSKQASGSTPQAVSPDQEFTVVEEMPKFPGGQSAAQEYLAKNVKYPAEAYNKGIRGRVIVQYVVEKDGSISNVRIVRGVDPLLDAEAVRVIKSMPKWEPGKQRGQKVRVKYTMPVTFSLQ